MTEKTYNGWTNYETWNVALWIGNEEGSQSYWQEQTEEAYRNAEAKANWTRKETAALVLSHQLEDEIKERNPLPDAGLYTDLLGAALSEVNWYEIVEHWLEDLDTDAIDDEDDDDEVTAFIDCHDDEEGDD